MHKIQMNCIESNAQKQFFYVLLRIKNTVNNLKDFGFIY